MITLRSMIVPASDFAPSGPQRIWAFSHNDEMQGKDALVLALSLGFGGIEVDTWLGPVNSSKVVQASQEDSFPQSGSKSPSPTLLGDEPLDPNMTLLAGHDMKDLAAYRTLKGLYLDPLMDILDKNNGHRGNGGWVGVYPADPRAQLIVAIDMKSNGDATWPYLVSALQPFLNKGYLTTYDPSTSRWTPGPLLIIGTGNTPLARVYHSPLRYIFFDAPLLSLRHPVSLAPGPAGPVATFEFDKTISPMASGKFPLVAHAGLGMPLCKSNPVVRWMRWYTAEAASSGIKSRWWGAARSPRWLRRRVWALQRMGGAEWVNADDLADAAEWLGGGS